MMDAKSADANYTFTIVGSPDEVVAALLNGEANIAAIPTNLAAKLYAKTEGEVQMLAINTLGTLYLLENGTTVNSIEDLRGKTVYATGQGANPQYVLEYLLAANGLTVGSDVQVEYKAEHSELAALLAAGQVDIAMLPEPNVTAVLSKNPDVRIALDFNDEWTKVAGEGSRLTMGCVVANKDFVEANLQFIDQFLLDLQESIAYAGNNLPETAALCAQFGIIPDAALAEAAIPNCNLDFISGADMAAAIAGYYQVLLAADPSSVGGALPTEDFYYSK